MTTFFSFQDYEYYIGQFFWVLFLNDEKEDLMMKFHSFSEMAFFWNNVYQSIKFQFPVTLKTLNIERSSVASVYFKTILYFSDWQFYELSNTFQFSSESCVLYMHFMWCSKCYEPIFLQRICLTSEHNPLKKLHNLRKNF